MIEPFVGPVPLGGENGLYGRDAEVTELFGLLMSRRIVLLHAPSGAGKTSLLRAGTELATTGRDRPPVGLIARLRAKRMQCLGPIRVGNPPPPELAERRAEPGPDDDTYIANRYTISAITSLDRAGGAPTVLPGEVARLRLRDYLERFAEQSAAPHGDHVLIFDQFEEVLTADPADIDQRVAFFRQLGAVLADPRWRAVIAMRSDYVGALDPYLGYVPDGLRCRFFLDLFTDAAARSALVGPARQHHLEFTDEAATKIITDLRGIVVQRPGTSEPARALGRYIEPVHLQLVAQRLWRRHATTIDIAAAAGGGDVDAALGDYYDDCLRGAAKLAPSEAAVRRWIEDNLINQQGIRGQLAKEPRATRGMRNAVIDKLIESFLLRLEDRRGVAWIELSHDRLVEPIRTRNHRARETRAFGHMRRALGGGAVVAMIAVALFWRSQKQRDERDTREQLTRDQDAMLEWASTNLVAGRPLSALTWLDAARQAGPATPGMRAMVREARHNLWSAAYVHAPAKPVVSIVFRVSDGGLVSADSTGRVHTPEAPVTPTDAPALASVVLDPLGRALALGRDGTITFQGAVAFDDKTLLGALPGTRPLGVLDRNGVNAAIATGDSFVIWSPGSTAVGPVRRPEIGPKERITGLTFSPNGETLAVLVAQRVELWRVRGTGAAKPIALKPDAGDITSVTFSASGYRIVVTTASGRVLLYSVFGHELAQGGIDDLALAVFGPNEQTFATMTRTGRAQIWGIEVGPGEKFVLQARTRLALQDRAAGPVSAKAPAAAPMPELGKVANSPQGRGAVGSGASESAFAPQRLLAWTPDGAALLTAGPGRTAALWDALDGNLLAAFEEAADITAVAVSPDGASVVLGTLDGSVRTWNASYQDVRATIHETGRVTAAAFGELAARADGDRRQPNPAAGLPREQILATATASCGVTLWLTTGQRKTELPETQPPRGGIASNVAIAGPRHVIIACDQLWRWDTLAGNVEKLEVRPLRVFFATDPHHFATVMPDGTVNLWDWTSRAQPVSKLSIMDDGVSSVAFSPDHAQVVTSHRDGVRLWRTRTGQMITFLPLRFPLASATFGTLPDGQVRVVVAGSDRPLLWNPAAAPPVAGLALAQPLEWVSMTPGGERVIAIRTGDTASVWSTSDLLRDNVHAPAQPTTNPLKHDAAITYYDVTADGSRFVTGTQDGVVQLWDLATGAPISAAKGFHDEPIVAFSPDGTRLFETGGDGLGRISDVQLATDEPEDWAGLVQRCSPFVVAGERKPVLAPRTPDERHLDRTPCQSPPESVAEQTVREGNRIASALARLPLRPKAAGALGFVPSTAAELTRKVPEDTNDTEAVRDLLAVLASASADLDPSREERLVAFTVQAHRPDLTLEVYRRLDATEKRRIRLGDGPADTKRRLKIAETQLLMHAYEEAAKNALRPSAPGKVSNPGYQMIATAVRWIALRMLADARRGAAATATATATAIAAAACELRRAYEAWASVSSSRLHWNWAGLQFLIDSSPHSAQLTRELRRVLDVLTAEPRSGALDSLGVCPRKTRDAR